MPRWRHPFRLLMFACWAVMLIVAAGYVIGVAWLQARDHSHLVWTDLLMPRLIDVVIVGWLAFVGSSVGSFLNVVAWRMPQGMSVQGRSFCPRCHTRLRIRDNFPVFGWLALEGRCRTCRLPISPRYPIVELLVAITFTFVGVGELYKLSLPLQSEASVSGPLSTPLVDASVAITVAYHLVVLTLVWAYGLIRIDGHRIPSGLAGVGIAATTVPMLVYPTLMCVPWQVDVPAGWSGDGLHVDAAIRVISAIAAGGVYARILAKGVCPDADLKLDPLGRSTGRFLDLLLVVSTPAVVVGWQTLPALIVLASLLAWLLNGIGFSGSDPLGRLAVAMPVALACQLAFWRLLHESAFWPSAGSGPYLLLAAAAVVLMIPFWLRDEDSDAASRD